MHKNTNATCDDLSEIDKLLFSIRRSVRYHNRRRAYYDRLHNISMFLSALAGTAIITLILSKMESTWSLIVAIMVTVFSILDLTIGTTEKARLHHDLGRRFISLEKEIISSPEQSDSCYPKYLKERLDIEADEPPPRAILNMMCHNEMLRAMGYPAEDQVEIKLYQRLCCHWFDWGEHLLFSKQDN